MSDLVRRWMFFVGVFGFVVLFVWGLEGLPPSGQYRGPYGDVVNTVANAERHVTDVVTAINFDYRGFDTLGEEFILFASVVGVSLLLRKQPDEREEADDEACARPTPATSDAVRFLGLSLIGVSITFGVYVVTHGQLSPGGGFQGGVILGTVPLLVFLAAEAHDFKRVAPRALAEISEAVGAAGYALVGCLGLFEGVEFLRNVIPLGPKTNVLSGGTIPLISASTGLEVAAGFIVLLTVFLDETLRRRLRRGHRE